MKYRGLVITDTQHTSHPTGVRGLKLDEVLLALGRDRRTPLGCVD